jgi:hypothetical protein
MIKAIIRLLIFSPVMWAAQILSVLLSIPAAYTADENGRLRFGLRWMETHDTLGWQFMLEEAAMAELAERYSVRWALGAWLRRNKAYTLRSKMGPRDVTYDRATDFGFSPDKDWSKWGFQHEWAWIIIDGKTYFEYQPMLIFGDYGRFYFRIGWKVIAVRNDVWSFSGNFGVFTGITPRTDDFDD